MFGGLYLMLSPFFYVLLFTPASLPVQDPQLAVNARECPSSWNNPQRNAKKKTKNSNAQQKEKGACIEMAVSPLEVQESAQSYARNRQWKIFEEHMTEDSWTFSRELSKDELLRVVAISPTAEKIELKSGVALVHIRSLELGDGFTRTVIRASFRGYGESADQFAVQRQYWELESNNSLENSMISALKERFKVRE